VDLARRRLRGTRTLGVRVSVVYGPGPFVYVVAAELLPYSDLLAGTGVTQTARLVDVLMKVRLKYGRLTPSSAAASKSSVHQVGVEVMRDLHVCVSVLNELKSPILAGCCESDLDQLHAERSSS